MKRDFWHTAVVNSWLVLWTVWYSILCDVIGDALGNPWRWLVVVPLYLALVYGYTAWQTRGTWNAWKNWSKAKPRPHWKVQP